MQYTLGPLYTDLVSSMPNECVSTGGCIRSLLTSYRFLFTAFIYVIVKTEFNLPLLNAKLITLELYLAVVLASVYVTLRNPLCIHTYVVRESAVVLRSGGWGGG